MHKKIIYILSIIFFITSCETMDSVKRGITGEKRASTDEFFIKKKDPLILPPDYDKLPTPGEKRIAAEEISSFEKKLKKTTTTKSTSSSSTSAEMSILQQIKRE